jgi:hypothetical protein
MPKIEGEKFVGEKVFGLARDRPYLMLAVTEEQILENLPGVTAIGLRQFLTKRLEALSRVDGVEVEVIDGVQYFSFPPSTMEPWERYDVIRKTNSPREGGRMTARKRNQRVSMSVGRLRDMAIELLQSGRSLSRKDFARRVGCSYNHAAFVLKSIPGIQVREEKSSYGQVSLFYFLPSLKSPDVQDKPVDGLSPPRAGVEMPQKFVERVLDLCQEALNVEFGAGLVKVKKVVVATQIESSCE